MFERKHQRRLLFALLGVVTLSSTACGTVGTTTEAEGGGGDCSMFDGETVTLVVPYSPGGGYDSYARIVAPYLAKELGAQVVVENQEGAGGLLAINNLMAAKPDGTRLAIMNGVGVAGGALAGAEGVQFALEDLSVIGRVAEQKPVFVVGGGTEYQTVEDVQAAESFQFASTGPGAADFVNASLLIQILGLDGRVVTGFDGSDESELAVVRGDVDGQTGDLDSRLSAIEAGDQRPILVLDAERAKDLPDIPALSELDLGQQEQALAESLIDLSAFGRPVVGPPGLPEDRLTCLRQALQQSVESPKLLDEANKQERPLSWLSGAELDERVQRLSDAPAEFQRSLRKAYQRE
jgi:tripartite-type tricarboxylate transporter receptor subunit TctC